MENSVYVTIARQTALQRQMDVVANNIANSSTTGFKREGTLFAEVIERLPESGQKLSMSSDPATFTDMSEGSIAETGDPLNVAILGRGLIAVDRDGETVYTRDGRFAVNPAGELALLTGERVLDAGGAPVQIPQNATRIAIAADGTLSADGRTIGQLGLFDTQAARLERIGNGLFRTDEPLPAVQPPLIAIQRPRFAQGFLETSNVNPVVELVRMIEIQRAYELGQNVLQAEHDRITSVTDIVGNTA